eukprot:TRINITY_DN1736_c0_g1_i1.p1 TRINITY_DN1736_c0_g1~~TRINITY_DN1736_c0_g1_i1.p1  ORF type:complete len:407 (-),score=71.97 TRINITY_DN1736_c0_g1_i1:668-1762(-)
MFKLSEDLIKQLDPKVLEGFDVENLEAITISDKMWRQLKSMMNEEEEEEGESGVQLTDEEIENYSRDSQMNMDPLLSKTYPKMASPSEIENAKLRRQYLLSGVEHFKIGVVALPIELKERITETLKGHPRSWLKIDGAALSDTLRARTTEHGGKVATQRKSINIGRDVRDPILSASKQFVALNTPVPAPQYNERQSLAYVAHRVPGIYSCNYRSFQEIKKRFSEFSPQSMLDFGSGPGTAIWAAKETWPDIKSYMAIEPSKAMTEVSKILLRDFPVHRRQYIDEGKQNVFDLVMASYSLSELDDDSTRALTIRKLWKSVKTGGALVIVEPGTPIGFKLVRFARSHILDLSTKDEKTNPIIIAPV